MQNILGLKLVLGHYFGASLIYVFNLCGYELSFFALKQIKIR